MYAFQAIGYQSEDSFSEESPWHRHQQYCGNKPDTGLRHWLLDRGSLTQRLIRASDGEFRVQLLTQCWQRPRPSERLLLGTADRELAIVREVLLRGHGEPWVFARSVIPASSLKGQLRQLRKLRDSSLGAMMFKDPGLRRQPFELSRIDGDSRQLPAANRSRCDSELWGRRCRFELADKPIMVSEFFLPAFLEKFID